VLRQLGDIRRDPLFLILQESAATVSAHPVWRTIVGVSLFARSKSRVLAGCTPGTAPTRRVT
jgi:hypothetical protein